MSRPMSIIVAAGLALFGASALAGAAEGGSVSGPNASTAIPVLGPAVNVPPGHFVKAFAYCPKGYYVTGGGAYSGAITEIVSSPTKDLHGWFVDGTNDDPLKRTFQHRAVAVCVKGSPAVSVASAASADGHLLRQAELEFASSRESASQH
jgi:hypothetical protein